MTKQLGCLEHWDCWARVHAQHIPRAAQHGQQWHGWALKQSVNWECERTLQGLCSAGNSASQQIPACSQRWMCTDSLCSMIRGVRIKQSAHTDWLRCLTMQIRGNVLCLVFCSPRTLACGSQLLWQAGPDGSSSMQKMFGPTAVLSQKSVFSLVFSLPKCSQPPGKPSHGELSSLEEINLWNPKADVLLAEEDQLSLCVSWAYTGKRYVTLRSLTKEVPLAQLCCLDCCQCFTGSFPSYQCFIKSSLPFLRLHRLRPSFDFPP